MNASSPSGNYFPIILSQHFQTYKIRDIKLSTVRQAKYLKSNISNTNARSDVEAGCSQEEGPKKGFVMGSRTRGVQEILEKCM